MTLTLPREAVAPPPPSIDGSSFLIIGAPKSGKSWLANRWPNCLVLDTQRGHVQLGGLVVQVQTPNDVRDVFGQLLKSCPYTAVAIDTLDDVSVWMEEEATATLRKKHGKAYADLTEIGHGTGWSEHRKLMRTLVQSFIGLPVTNLFIAHSRNMIDEESGEQSKMLDLPGRLAHLIPGEVDSVGISYRDQDGRYMISFEGYETQSATRKDRDGNVTKQGKLVYQAGSRFSGLQGKHFEASYEAISKAVAGGSGHSA